MTVARERRRLRAAFGAALVAAGALPIVQACSQTVPPLQPGPATDSGVDATLVDATGDVGVDSWQGPDSPSPSVDAAQDGPVADGNACAVTFKELDGSAVDAQPDADICDLVLPCGLNTGLTTQGCTVVQADVDGAPISGSAFGCVVADDAGCYDDAYAPPPGGALGLVCPCSIFVSGGRRPRGLRKPPMDARASSLAQFLARAAHLEAASVEAFGELETDLARLGAPTELLRAARRAGKDEVRHARVLDELAADQGCLPRRLQSRRRHRTRTRSVEAIARENAVEGCVRETFGALVAEWQARHAARVELRDAFARIASDETRHAALAWAVAGWVEPQLDAAARRRIDRARRRAARKLAREVAFAPPERVVLEAGVPRAPQALAMLEHLFGAGGRPSA